MNGTASLRQMTAVLCVCVLVCVRINEAMDANEEFKHTLNARVKMMIGEHDNSENQTNGNISIYNGHIDNSNKTQPRSPRDMFVETDPSESTISETVTREEMNKVGTLSLILLGRQRSNVQNILENKDVEDSLAGIPHKSSEIMEPERTERAKRTSNDCFINDMSTCPWKYDSDNNAVCLQQKPISCDHDYCLLKCELLTDYNQKPIACIAVRPCLIQAAGDVVHTSQCK